MRFFKIILLVFVVLIIAVIFFLFPIVDLPKPSGAYAVGTRYLSFEDSNRKEPFAEGNRQLPVQVWYPASEDSDETTAPWIGSAEAMRYFTEYRGLPDLLGYFSWLKTNSHLNAEISDHEDKYPMLLFSGGGGMFYGQNVLQMEELASHGYVVFAVGHPYEDFADVYPDGRIVSYSETQKERLSADQKQGIEAARQSGVDESSEEFIRIMLRNAPVNKESVHLWADDFSFILDQITELNQEDGWIQNRLDVYSVGAFGHSFGGAAAGQFAIEDSRVQAFVNMDGSPFGDAPDTVIEPPFMVLTAGEKSRTTDGYSDQQKNYIEVSVLEAAHMNFTDLNSLIPILGKITGFLGNISEYKQNEITNAYLLDFFDHTLKGQENTALFKPGESEAFDGVVVAMH